MPPVALHRGLENRLVTAAQGFVDTGPVSGNKAPAHSSRRSGTQAHHDAAGQDRQLPAMFQSL